MVCLAFKAHPATARCADAVMLGGLHDAYNATLRGSHDVRQRAATALLVFVGGQTGKSLSRQLARDGIDAPPDRLEALLSQAQTLAQDVLNSNLVAVDTYRHGRNVDWLASLYLSSGCQNSMSTTSQNVGAASYENARHRTQDEKTSNLLQGKTSKVVMVVIGILLFALAVGIYRFSQSFIMRRRMVERLPRFPIALSLDLTFTDPDGNMQQASGDIVDISQGGLKLSWPDPPPAKTLVTVTLLATQRLGQVMWSNNHFAGVMFETRLTRPELKSLMDSHPPT